MKNLTMLTVILGLTWVGMAVPQTKPVRFIAHRGESMDAPENTMPAFRLALDRNLLGFECDVYMTADNQLICLHDQTLDRTTDGSGKPGDFTLAELKKLDAGSWKGERFKGERMPTLDEALTLACPGREIYIDIKRGVDIPRLVEVVKAEPRATADRIVFLGGRHNIPQLRQLLPDYRAYWCVGVREKEDGTLSPSAQEAVAALKQMGAHGIDIQAYGAAAQRLIDREYIRTVKEAGFSFHVWTINHPTRAAQLAEMGAETITTDCGGRLHALLTEPPPPLPTPLVHWTFDGGSVANRGTGGTAFNAELIGSPERVAGVRGEALRLDGKDDAVRLAYRLPAQGSVALWFKPDGFYNYNTVMDNEVNADWWEMWIYETGVLKFRVANGTGEVACNLQSFGGAGRWYHIVVVWDFVSARVAKLFVDGAECASRAMPQWVEPGSHVTFGGGHPGNKKGRGDLDDVRLYREPLSDAQVWALFSNTK
ncbi:MAG TPA: glycerophosphodiester phosphodiesterase family protein [Kiritimatiellia bacterium]|nr:glycerophosphodiester phosphodiesterase family protein [Kiritimatiellia bacterium]HRU71265.1 glycerophosphodiester phosphodiesterase family protein [Kiritimatiellia bacterium]